MTTRRPISALLSRLANRDGAAAVEFAILAPILALVLAGAVDFGGVVFVKFGLDNAVSAATNYAVVSKTNVSATNGGSLAQTMAAVITNGTSDVAGTILVNNGPQVTITAGVAAAPGGTAANAGNCYCPTRSGGAITWGGSVTCNSACGGGGKAGKFVTIDVTRPYTPLFSGYGFIDPDAGVRSIAVVQTE